jgi:dehydrogenase/reductase SDR family protein 7
VGANLDVFQELIELNYLGTVSLTTCVLPHMIERKQGKIVTVNSLVGVAATPLSSGYCASKYALRVRLLKL